MIKNGLILCLIATSSMLCMANNSKTRKEELERQIVRATVQRDTLSDRAEVINKQLKTSQFQVRFRSQAAIQKRQLEDELRQIEIEINDIEHHIEGLHKELGGLRFYDGDPNPLNPKKLKEY